VRTAPCRNRHHTAALAVANHEKDLERTRERVKATLEAQEGRVTERSECLSEVESLVSRTVSAVRNPVCLGFGLSKSEQIARAFSSGARLAVVGSHLANVIGEAWEAHRGDRGEKVVSTFGSAVRSLCSSS